MSKFDEIRARLEALETAQEAAKPHYVTYMNTQHLPDMHGYPIAVARRAIEANAPDDLRAMLAVVEAAMAMDDALWHLPNQIFHPEIQDAVSKFRQAVAKLTGEAE